MCEASDFRRSERNFTIGQGPKIQGTFSNICIKITNNLKSIEKIRELCKVLQKYLIFGRNYVKNKGYNK